MVRPTARLLTRAHSLAPGRSERWPECSRAGLTYVKPPTLSSAAWRERAPRLKGCPDVDDGPLRRDHRRSARDDPGYARDGWRRVRPGCWAAVRKPFEPTRALAPPSAAAYSASSSRLPALSDRPYSAAVKIAENRGYGPARYFVPRRSPRSQVPSSRRARSGACTGASIARR